MTFKAMAISIMALRTIIHFMPVKLSIPANTSEP